MERIILAAILVAALAAAGIMIRRSFRRASGGACSGCPMAGSCGGSHAEGGDSPKAVQRDEAGCP